MQTRQIRSEAQFIVLDDIFHLQIVAQLAISSYFATIEKKKIERLNDFYDILKAR